MSRYGLDADDILNGPMPDNNENNKGELNMSKYNKFLNTLAGTCLGYGLDIDEELNGPMPNNNENSMKSNMSLEKILNILESGNFKRVEVIDALNGFAPFIYVDVHFKQGGIARLSYNPCRGGSYAISLYTPTRKEQPINKFKICCNDDVNNFYRVGRLYEYLRQQSYETDIDKYFR